MSKKFNFKLQKLLQYKQNIEDQYKSRFSIAQSNYNKSIENLNDLKKEYKSQQKNIETSSLFDMKLIYSYLKILNIQIEESEKEVKTNLAKLNIAREELINKQIERKAVEILKEKEREKFVKETDEAEQKEMDEYGLQQFIRK